MGHHAALNHASVGVGVMISLVGLHIAAPDGLREARRALWAFTLQVCRRITGHSATVHAVSAHAALQASSSTGVSVRPGWDPSASPEQRDEVLYELFTILDKRIDDVQRQARQRHREVSTDLAALRGELKAEIAAIKSRLDAEEERSSQIDARGLPVVGLGIVLSNVPAIVSRWLALGWIAVGLSIAVTAVMLRATISERSPTSP